MPAIALSWGLRRSTLRILNYGGEVKYGLIAFASAYSILVSSWLLGLRANLTPSLPVGIYMETSRATDYVLFCLDGAAAQLALQRRYVGSGRCRNGSMALLKRLLAKSGDTVTLTAEGISVNGKLVPNTAPLRADTEGRPLEHYPFGTYPVGKSALWLGSGYDGRSFDARYFGPVDSRSIQSHLSPILTW